MEGVESIIAGFEKFLMDKNYPCVAARAALSRDHIQKIVVDNMACPKDDFAILEFLYAFIGDYRKAKGSFYSAAVIFKGPNNLNEEMFDTLLWQRLQSLSSLDAKKYSYDQRVEADPSSPHFSFSLMKEALFIVGLHPGSSRPTRQFAHPTLIFNPHAQFEELRKTNRYEKMKQVVRKRDLIYAGSINPMLNDFGERSEVFQYSGKQYASEWQCPLNVEHGKTDHHPSA